jgi:cobalamin biosynthesis Mg chelatase CobN
MDAGLQLKRINDKLQDLLKKYELLQKENDKLREIGFMEQISILEQKIMVLKTNVGKMDETDRKELDKKLHGYLKEIDRCISMLSE